MALAPTVAQRIPDHYPSNDTSGRHTIAAYAPDLTLLNNDERGLRIGYARATSAALAYQYEFAGGNWVLGAFGGPAMTHPRLEGIAGRWSGFELGVTGGLGGYLDKFWWMGVQGRVSIVRSPFRIDGYVPAEDGTFFRPIENVRGALRQNNFEGTGLTRVFFGTSGIFINLEFGLIIYNRGIFSDADLYPGFTVNGPLFFPTSRLPQDEYHGNIALRGRVGLGWTL